MAAERVGFRPPSTKWTAEGPGVELLLVRVQRSRQQRLGWSTASAATTTAAAGVRVNTARHYAWLASELGIWADSWEHREHEDTLKSERR